MVKGVVKVEHELIKASEGIKEPREVLVTI